MHIDLPQDILERVQKRTAATRGASEADVIRQALDSLDWHDEERLAIEQGIAAWRAKDVQDFDDFDAEFRAENNI